MARNFNQKRRSNSLKAEDEIDLYRLFTHASQTLKWKFKLKNSKVKDSKLDIRFQLRKHDWRNPDFSGIDFDDIAKCCAYLERYAICHAALTRHATQWFLRKISGSEIERSLFQKESLKVVCVGGGPGNDLLGFCSVVEGVPRTFKDLEMTVVDLKAGWKDAFEVVMATVKSLNFGKAGILLEDKKVQVTLKFRQADLACGVVDEIKEADLILMVKVLSNVCGSKRSKLLKNIFSAMKGEAVFLYIDVLSSKVEKQANQPDSDMNVLFTKKCQTFGLSVGKEERKNLILKSTYEICILQKDFGSTSVDICDAEKQRQIVHEDKETDGEKDGESGGDDDGESIGDDDGESIGDDDGGSDGEDDGGSDGEDDGGSDGEDDGGSDGEDDGGSGGENDGKSDGEDDGKSDEDDGKSDGEDDEEGNRKSNNKSNEENNEETGGKCNGASDEEIDGENDKGNNAEMMKKIMAKMRTKKSIEEMGERLISQMEKDVMRRMTGK